MQSHMSKTQYDGSKRKYQAGMLEQEETVKKAKKEAEEEENKVLDGILCTWRNAKTGQVFHFYKIDKDYFTDVRDDEEHLREEPWDLTNESTEVGVMSPTSGDGTSTGRVLKAFNSTILIPMYGHHEYNMLVPIWADDIIVRLKWYVCENGPNIGKRNHVAKKYIDKDDVHFLSDGNAQFIWDYIGAFVRM